MKKYCLLIVLAILTLVSCDRSSVEVQGRVACCPEADIYLDIILPDRQEVVDSVKSDKQGNFKFNIKNFGDDPMLYNLRFHKGNDIIPLLLSRGESVDVRSVGHISKNYIVNGSAGSQLIKELSTLLQDGASTLDSLGQKYNMSENEDEKTILLQAYTKKYYSTKQDHIKFLVYNANSIVAIYALLQRLPNDENLLDGESDMIYYRMVADSTKHVYPNSIYVKSLEKLISDYDSQISMIDMIQHEVDKAKNYPDLKLPDMYGSEVKLSDSDGKVILVDFWSVSTPASKLINAELKELYEEYAEKGFEVYQISVDVSKSAWLSSVREQKLPWISVCDLLGESSPAITIYNVQNVPNNYLIDQKGNIVDKNIYGDQLNKRLSELIN